MSQIIFELARHADDPELRRILRENPFSGAISVSFEREPNYFTAAKVEGPFHQTIVARRGATGEIIGIGSRSIRDVYLNGSPQAIGYLSQLRIGPQYRVMRRALAGAFTFLHRLHQDGRVPFYFSSIIEDNLPARRLLTAGLPGLPCLREYARMHTLAIYAKKAPVFSGKKPEAFSLRKRQRAPVPGGVQLARGSSAHVNAIVACLQRNGARYQFAPCWTNEALFSPDHTPGLVPGDFFLALDGERVVGCLAAWDQSSFKQSVVRGYSGRLARWRWLMSIGARIAGLPVLPPPNMPIRHCYASHMAVDDDDLEVFAALLRCLHNHSVDRGYSYFMLGLCENHPFLETVRSTYPHIDYKSQLYLVAWEDELEVLSQIDNRLPGVEIAVL